MRGSRSAWGADCPNGSEAAKRASEAETAQQTGKQQSIQETTRRMDSKENTMSKKRPQPKQEAKEIEPATDPKPKGFVPRPCSQCTALRPPKTSYSYVYCTRGKVRYCKCGRCNNTWSEYFDNCTTAIVHTYENIVTQETSTPSLEYGISGIVTSTD